MVSNFSTDISRELRLLTALSGIIVIITGVLLAVKAPFLLAEYTTVTDGYSYSMTYITRYPVLPTFIVILGILTFASALRRYRHLSLLTSLCLGLIITSLTFTHLNGFGGHRVTKFGHPLGWLAWITPPPMMRPHIIGIVALPFLIDLFFWSFIVSVIIFTVNRIKSILAPGKMKSFYELLKGLSKI